MSERILLLNRWPQYLDGQRWDNELARPDALIPHDRYCVTYICDPAGRRGVPVSAHDVHQVPDFKDVNGIVDLVGELVLRDGPFDHLIAFSEYLLDLAAVIRERYDIPGPRPQEINRFRDKIVMKQLLHDEVRVPQWFACASPGQVLVDARRLGFPLILKPTRGASSENVRKITCVEDLESICSHQDLNGYEIEEYISGDLLHADGVVDRDGKCLFMCVSRYVAPCLDFEHGMPLGSILQTDPSLQARCERFVRRVLLALNLRASAFHLEFFEIGEELVFLEIGARVPGADVSYVIHDVHGVNLFRLWVDVLLGRESPPIRVAGQLSGGWLMIPRPQPLPQKILRSTPLVGKIDFLYRELVPAPGQILERSGGYATLQGGRFLFRGGTQRQIEDAVQAAQREYELVTAPIDVPGRD